MSHDRLICIGIATLVINRTKDRGWIETVHERTGPVIDCLAAQSHVVCVHYPMDESHSHPMSDRGQLVISLPDRVGQGLYFRDSYFRKMTIDGVVQ